MDELLEKIDKKNAEIRQLLASDFKFGQTTPIVCEKYTIKEISPLSRKGNIVKNTDEAYCVHVNLYSNEGSNINYVATTEEIKEIEKSFQTKKISELKGKEIMLFRNRRSKSLLKIKYISNENYNLINSMIDELHNKFIIDSTKGYADYIKIKKIIPYDKQKNPVENFRGAYFFEFRYNKMEKKGFGDKVFSELFLARDITKIMGKLNDERCLSLEEKSCFIERVTKTKNMIDIKPYGSW